MDRFFNAPVPSGHTLTAVLPREPQKNYLTRSGIVDFGLGSLLKNAHLLGVNYAFLRGAQPNSPSQRFAADIFQRFLRKSS